MSHVMQSLGHNKNPLFTEVCRDSRDRFANFKPTGKQGAPRLLRPTEGCRCSQFECVETVVTGSPTSSLQASREHRGSYGLLKAAGQLQAYRQAGSTEALTAY